MTHRDDLDQMLTAWLDDPYTPPAPGYLGEVLERTRRTRQRPAWTSLERWLPMADKIARPALAPPLRVALIVLISLLLVALAATIVVVGSQLLNPKQQVYDIPRGGEAVLVLNTWAGDASGLTGGDLFTVKADGTDLRRLTTGPGIETSPTWSPDGKRIAYRLWANAADSIVVIDGGGGNQKTVATTPSRDCGIGNLAWSPDGRSLIFTSNAACEGPYPYDLSIVATDGASPATRLLAPGTDGIFASWSPDGKRIAFLGRDIASGTTGVYTVDVAPAGALSGGLQAHRIAPGPADLDNASMGPQWSPDGTLLAVTEGDRIVVMNPDGSGQRTVAQNAFNPAWSPNGQRLAFHRTVDPSEYFGGRPCTVRTWIVDASGTNERRLDELNDGCDAVPLWSPDGTRLTQLVIASTPAEPVRGFHLGVVTVDGSSPLVLLQDAGGTWQPLDAPLPPAPSFAPVSPTP